MPRHQTPVGGSSVPLAVDLRSRWISSICRSARARTRAIRSLTLASSVPVEPVDAGLDAAQEERPGDPDQEEVPGVPALPGLLPDVGREVPLDGAADLVTIVPELAQGLLDLLGEHRVGQRLRCSRDRALGDPEDALRPLERDEARATHDGGGLGRTALDLGRDVDRVPDRCLESDQLGLEIGTGGDHPIPGGIRLCSHSRVSLLVSMVWVGVKRVLRASTSMPVRAASMPRTIIQTA